MSHREQSVERLSLAAVLAVCFAAPSRSEEPSMPTMRVSATEDFAVTGSGESSAWRAAPWTQLNKRGEGGHDYETRVKMLYSKTGLYILMDGSDHRLTATLREDFLDLWKEDVFEFFLWTDERYPVYFEYEISPLGYELPILIPNFEGRFLGWRPWHYDNDRKTKKAVQAIGGPAQSGARIERWRAEIYVPYDLLRPLQNVPPRPGTKWRANFYRVDYDDGKTTSWDWARVGKSFHEYTKFGTIVFE